MKIRNVYIVKIVLFLTVIAVVFCYKTAPTLEIGKCYTKGTYDFKVHEVLKFGYMHQTVNSYYVSYMPFDSFAGAKEIDCYWEEHTR